MALLGSKNKKKVASSTPRTSSATTSSTSKPTTTTVYPHQSTLLSRLPPNASTPTVHQQQYNTNLSNQSSPTLGSSSTQQHRPSYQTTSSLISPFDSPTPTPSTSWTSEMSAFVDKLRDDAASIVGSSKYQQQLQAPPPLDRRSVSQGMKLVAIAADEYEEGNDAVALDIYLSGIDKILMALPNKTDPRTKMAIREKLQSVEERVGILNLATQYKQLPNIDLDNDHDDKRSDVTPSGPATTSTTTTSSSTTTTTTTLFSRISTTMNTISSIGSTTVQAWEENNALQTSSDQRDSIQRFKRFGRFVINASVTCAVLIKQSPIPDIIGLICTYLLHLLYYLDQQYDVREKAQSLGVECVKLLLAADERYHLHEIATETIYMLIAASLKAAVAFKESPSYHHHPANSSLNNAKLANDTNDARQIEYQDSIVSPSPSTSSSSTSPPPPPPPVPASRLPKMLSGWY